LHTDEIERSPLAARPLERRVGPGFQRSSDGGNGKRGENGNPTSNHQRVHLAMPPLCSEPKTATNEAEGARPAAVNEGTARGRCNEGVTEKEADPALGWPTTKSTARLRQTRTREATPTTTFTGLNAATGAEGSEGL
jgi:hypothetical protein